MSYIKKLLLCIVLSAGIFVLFACNQGNKNFPTPPQYDLNHPVKIILPAELDEISGIVYYPKDTSIFAISDETGWLYKIFPDKRVPIQKWKFSKNHDYEDLQLVDSTFYILSSKGNILSCAFYADSFNVETFEFPDKDKNEFESLYFDKTTGLLNLICKNCKSDTKSFTSVWSFNPATKSYAPDSFTIDVNSIDKQEKEKIKFRPSAAAINPFTNELFILSSVNKALVIADKKGNIKKVYPLNSFIYRQPEGITFTSSGDLLISNEADKEYPADILVIKLKRKI